VGFADDGGDHGHEWQNHHRVLIHHLMKSEWHRAGLLGTVTVDDGEISEPATHTTPGPEELESLLARMRDNGCRGVAMEVSSMASTKTGF